MSLKSTLPTFADFQNSFTACGKCAITVSLHCLVKYELSKTCYKAVLTSNSEALHEQKGLNDYNRAIEELCH